MWAKLPPALTIRTKVWLLVAASVAVTFGASLWVLRSLIRLEPETAPAK